jgi:hypothetical protein
MTSEPREEEFQAGISQLSVDLLVRDLARLS